MIDTQGQAMAGEPKLSKEAVRTAKIVKCECGGMVFEEKMAFKRVSAIMSPSGKEEFFPLNLVVCTSCGLVPKDFDPHKIIPEELLAKEV